MLAGYEIYKCNTIATLKEYMKKKSGVKYVGTVTGCLWVVEL
jgi:hypothetical protein